MPSKAYTLLRPDRPAIMRLMVKRGFNRTGLAKAAGIHRNSIINLFRGDHDVALRTINKLAQALKVSPLRLLETVVVIEEGE